MEFFETEEPAFPSLVEKAVSGILKIDGVELKNIESGIGDGFFRLDVTEGDACLTIDFVNDIAFRLGTPEKKDGVKVDTLSNILTDKISAVVCRDELEDIVDIREMCRNCRFMWSVVPEASQKKEASVDGEYIDYKLSSLVDFLKRHNDGLDYINWIQRPGVDSFVSDLEKIRRDILTLSENSLASSSAVILEDLCPE